MKINIKKVVFCSCVIIASLVLWPYLFSSGRFDFKEEHKGLVDFTNKLKGHEITIQDAKTTLISQGEYDEITIQNVDKKYVFCIIKVRIDPFFSMIAQQAAQESGMPLNPEQGQRVAFTREKGVYMEGATLSTESQYFRFIKLEDFELSSGGILQLPVFQIIKKENIAKK